MQTAADLLLTNVSLPDGRRVDITVEEGFVAHTGAPRRADRTIDCTGLIVMPAGVDLHVHMRGGVQRGKEDWESGSMSAIAGGVTVVVDQPNTIPPLTTPAAITGRVAEALSHSRCHFALNGGAGQGVDLAELWRSGVMAFGELFAAPSSYGVPLEPGMLGDILAEIRLLGARATIHAEEVLPGRAGTLPEHHKARSPAGEYRAVLDVHRENRAGTPLHFCHLSTAGAVKAAAGATVEVAPHHLLLSLEQFDPEDTHAKVNPPVRPDRERRLLRACWKRIDLIASDHAPHSLQDKDAPFADAPSGIPGVETMVPLLMAGVLNRRFTRASVMDKTCYRPADCIGIPRAGYDPGNRADFALYPRRCTRIDADLLHSRARWTPYEGYEAVFPIIVVMGGQIVFEEGQFFRGEPRWFHGKGYIKDRAKDDRADRAHP
ncbi:MAG: amidohydrolase family protein [Methanoregulaceae archaeon]|nr:amidohydrolase family protein [Methanoregulaceae archaeon]